VNAQQNTANLPFPLGSGNSASFNTVQNVRRQRILARGGTIYNAFNVAAETRGPHHARRPPRC